jgi:hypothetical protein
MNTIFLDIDGVLATNKEYGTNRTKFRKKYPEAERLRIPYPFNKGCVDIFNEIITETNSFIVLSSDWREYWNLSEIDEIFKYNGVIKSPEDFTTTEIVSFGNSVKNRVYQIGQYLNTHPEITNWVAIDDMNMKGYMKITNEDDKMVLTKDSEGLKQKGIKNKIINILNPKL